MGSMDKAREPYERPCKICGKPFTAVPGKFYCDDCRNNVKCYVCGKVFRPKPAQFTRYVKRGYLTCGDKSCQSKMRLIAMQKNKGL